MPPLIEVVDHDANLVHRSRQRSRSREHQNVRKPSALRRDRINIKSQILLLEDLYDGNDQSFGADELLDYARELKILKNPMLGQFYVNLPWVVTSMSVSELAINHLPHSTHSGAFEWIGKEVCATPKYLWDSHEGRTVVTTEEMLREGYIAVSWTWGRYQRRSQGCSLERRSRGVGAFGRRWNVPQLPIGPSGKDVLSDLKVCLKSIESCRYFWVDLLCINQHKSYEKKQEIAKQASIFGGARATICYLWQQEKPEHFTEALEGVGSLLNWALVFGDTSLLSKRTGTSVEQQFPTSSARHYEHAYHAKFGKLKDDHWFTSLWALQEIVLAPSGVWMTRYGDLCKINGRLLTTRLMAIIIRLLSWAGQAREELWKEVSRRMFIVLREERQPCALSSANFTPQTRRDAGIAPKEWDQLQELQRAEESNLRDALRTAFADLSKDWQDQAPRNQQTWLGIPLKLPLRPRSAPPLFRSREPITADDGFQGIVVQADGITHSDGHWLFGRYKKEQGLREEIRKWTAWSLGHACIDVALPTTRAAIIVAGAKRSIMESHDQSREIALLAALKVEPPGWFSNGFEEPKEIIEQRSRQHLSPILLNTILKNENNQRRGAAARLFDVTHNLPRRTADTSVDMNDFDETEWDQTEFETDYILEKEVPEEEDTYQALSSMQTERVVRRISYDFHGQRRYAKVTPGEVTNLTDMLPDTASMLDQHVLHFASEKSIRWKSCDGWHMHKDGVLHLPHRTQIQQISKARRRKRHVGFDLLIRPNGTFEADYEVRSYKDLKIICQTQSWLLTHLGHSTTAGRQLPRFRFLPLAEYPRRHSSRSPSPHLPNDQTVDEQEVIGVVLVAKAIPQDRQIQAESDSPHSGAQVSDAVNATETDSKTEQASPNAAETWHKFGTYRATRLETGFSPEPRGFFVVSYADRHAVESCTKRDCDWLEKQILHGV